MLALEKTRPTDRHRGGAAFVETHTGAFYGKLGYLAGIGRSSAQIAEELGVTMNYVTKTLANWSIRRPDAYCQVPLTYLQRCTLVWRAEKAGVTPEDWLGEISTAAIRDGVYDGLVGE